MYKNITRTFYGGPQFEHFGARSRGAFGKFHMIWCQPIHTGSGSMLSAIISTHESERVLVPTLAALVPGATAGLLGEVIVADAGSRDATAEVADVAGCRFMASSEPLGARLKAAAASTRTPWLMFLRAGCVLEQGWVEAATRFIEATDRLDNGRAAVFRPPGVADLLRPGLALSLIHISEPTRLGM